MLYRKEEIQALAAQMKKTKSILTAVTAVALAAIIVTFILRLQTVTVVLTVLLGAALIFSIDLVWLPMKRQMELTKGALSNRIHTTNAVFLRHGDPSVINGIYAHGTFWCEDPKAFQPGELLLYAEDSRILPELKENKEYRLIWHGRFLCGIEEA